jgi:hypothetical protein
MFGMFCTTISVGAAVIGIVVVGIVSPHLSGMTYLTAGIVLASILLLGITFDLVASKFLIPPSAP